MENFVINKAMPLSIERVSLWVVWMLIEWGNDDWLTRNGTYILFCEIPLI